MVYRYSLNFEKYLAPTGFFFGLYLILSFVVLLNPFVFKTANALEGLVLPPGFEAKEIVWALNKPTDIAFSDDGRWFISERAGTVRVVENGKLLKDPLLDISDHVSAFQDGGLLTVALDPDFQTNGYIYLLYAYRSPGTEMSDPQTNRLTRLQLDPVTANVMTPPINPPEKVLVGSISTPYDRGQNGLCKAGSDCMPFDDGNHASDQILFAPDKTMFISMGDGSSAEHTDERALRSQDKNWMSGKVLRIDREGKGLESNPFWNGDPDAPISKVYHYGLRNPFRLTLHPQLGLFIADVGLNKWEEINYSPTPGANFGWPCFEGNFVRTGYSSDPDTKPTCDNLYSNPESVTPPLYSYPHPVPDTGGAIIGGAFYFGDSYPLEFQGNYFFAELYKSYMKRVVIDSTGKFVSAEEFATGLPVGTTKVFTFPDGDLGWLAFYTGKIYEISYSAGNRPPVAVASSNLTFGSQLPLEVQFNGQESFDPDGDQVTYSWDFGDGTTKSDQASPNHSFSNAGTYFVTLTVEDDKNVKSMKQILVYPGNSPPHVSISSPASNLTFRDGDHILFSGIASDNEDGNITDSAARWKLILHHENHIHEIPFDNNTGMSGEFIAKYHGDNTSYELELSVTDSGGLASRQSVNFGVTYDSKYSYQPSYQLLGGNYFELPSSPSLQLYKFSLAAWFNTNKNDGTVFYIVNRGGGGLETSGSNQNYGIWMNAEERIVGGFESSSSVNHFVTSPLTYNDSKWHYAVATYDGSTTILYIDGMQVGTVPAKQEPDTTTNPLRVGANSEPLNGFFVGQIDEIRLWDRPLSAAEITDQYNNGKFETSGQILYLPFDESSNEVIPANLGLESYGIKAVFSNGDVNAFRIEPESKSISFQLNTRGASSGEGKIELILPRDLLDATNGATDTEFTIMIGNNNTIQYHEVLGYSDKERKLEFVVPEDSTEVTIVGTRIIPEFPASLLALVAAGAIGSLFSFRWKLK